MSGRYGRCTTLITMCDAIRKHNDERKRVACFTNKCEAFQFGSLVSQGTLTRQDDIVNNKINAIGYKVSKVVKRRH